MPNLFARTTPLPDLAGRLDYIANPDRQEHLLAVYDSAESLLDGRFWEILAQECQASFTQNGRTVQRVRDKKTGEVVEKKLKCREAREIHMLLSNSLLDRMSPEEITQALSKAFETALGSPNRVALHFNKTKKSLHAHIILPERHLLQEPDIRIAACNLFYDANGKRVYRKSLILDENKQLLPGCRVCKKGEIYHQRYFSNTDRDMKTRAWLKSLKTDVILRLRNGALRGDVEITEYDPASGKLAQQYVGKKIDDEKKVRIEACNEMVKIYNGLVDAGRITHDEALRIQEEYNRQTDRNAYLAAKLEEIRLRERKEREIRETAEKKTQTYSRPGWIRSSDGLPYRIRAYDEHGRKRSLIELIVILAVVTIRNEHPVEPAECEHRPIKAKVDYKVQAMMDTVSIAREEGVRNLAEIEDRLHQVGKKLSQARAAAHRLSESKNRMDVLVQAVADCERLEGLCEQIYAMPDDDLEKHIQMAQNAGNLERYKAAKAEIYRAGLADSAAREGFLARHQDISQKAAEAERAAAELKAQYHRLSKLQHNVKLAQTRQYCYDLDYCPDPPMDLDIEPRETETQQEAQSRRTWNGADENDGGFSGDR